MKKFLSLLLALTLALSCFSVVSFAEDDDDLKYEKRPDCVAQVIDPIINDLNTTFSKSLNQVGYDSVDALANAGGSITDLNAFLKDAKASDNMLGLTLSELYTEKYSPYNWSNLIVNMVSNDDHILSTKNNNITSCSYKQMYDACAEVLNGNIYDYPEKSLDKEIFAYISEYKCTTSDGVEHYNYCVSIKKTEISLARGNINLYLKRVISNYWGGGKFYTKENLLTLTNFIGLLLNPKFNVYTEIPSIDNIKMDADDFFGKLAELSGLSDILEINWCKQPNVNFLPLIGALGVDTDDLLEREKEEGYYLGRRLLRDMFSGFCAAPLSYVLNILRTFAIEYPNSYLTPIKALLSIRLSQSVKGDYSEEDFATLTGFFNFLSNSTDKILNKMYGDSSPLGDNLQFAELPVRRFAFSEEQDEFFLMLIAYLDINRIYKNNKSVLERLWSNFEKNSQLTAEEMKTVKAFYSEYVQGGLTMKSFLCDMLDDVTSSNFDQIGNDILNSFKTSIATLLKKIVDAIDNFVRILLGESNPFEKFL